MPINSDTFNGRIILPEHTVDIINPPHSSRYAYIANKVRLPNVVCIEQTDSSLTFTIGLEYDIMDFTDYRWVYSSVDELEIVCARLCYNYIGFDFYSIQGDERNNAGANWVKLDTDQIGLSVDDEHTSAHTRKIITNNLRNGFFDAAHIRTESKFANFPFNMMDFRYGVCGSRFFTVDDMDLGMNLISVMQTIANNPQAQSIYKVWDEQTSLPTRSKSVALKLTIPRDNNNNKTYMFKFANPYRKSFFTTFYYDETVPVVEPTHTVTTYTYIEGSVTPTRIGNIMEISAIGNDNKDVTINIDKTTSANILIDKTVDLRFSLTKEEHTV